MYEIIMLKMVFTLVRSEVNGENRIWTRFNLFFKRARFQLPTSATLFTKTINYILDNPNISYVYWLLISRNIYSTIITEAPNINQIIRYY